MIKLIPKIHSLLLGIIRFTAAEHTYTAAKNA